jgi:hypothetical protein
VRTARRGFEFSASIAFVTGMIMTVQLYTYGQFRNFHLNANLWALSKGVI